MRKNRRLERWPGLVGLLIVGVGIALVLVSALGSTAVDGNSIETTPLPVTATPTSAVAPPVIPTTTAAPASALTPGFADASSTGVPAGTVLRSSGEMTIDTVGTVIDGYDIGGTLYINASNVTVRNTRVRSTNWWVIKVKDGLSGVVIEDCEVVGGGMSGVEGQFGIVGPVTVRGCDISGVTDGVVPSSGSVVESNYIHGLLSPGEPHYDGIQIDGGISDVVIRGNTIINPHDQTSAVMIDNWFGPIRNIRVEGNRLVGGGYTVYSDGQFSGGSISGVSFINNRLGKGRWGYASIANNTVTDVGNVDDDTGEVIDL